MLSAAIEPNDQVTLAALAVISMLAAGLVFVVKGYRESRAANNAVNHTEFGEKRLFDRVVDLGKSVDHLIETQTEFQKLGWGHLPSDMADAPALTETIRSVQRADEDMVRMFEAFEARNVEEHARIMETLRSHIEWEESQKYSRPDE